MMPASNMVQDISTKARIPTDSDVLFVIFSSSVKRLIPYHPYRFLLRQIYIPLIKAASAARFFYSTAHAKTGGAHLINSPSRCYRNNRGVAKSFPIFIRGCNCFWSREYFSGWIGGHSRSSKVHVYPDAFAYLALVLSISSSTAVLKRSQYPRVKHQLCTFPQWTVLIRPVAPMRSFNNAGSAERIVYGVLAYVLNNPMDMPENEFTQTA